MQLSNASTNLFGKPDIVYGSKPMDGGHFFVTDSGRTTALAAEPALESVIRPFLGAYEFFAQRAALGVVAARCTTAVAGPVTVRA